MSKKPHLRQRPSGTISDRSSITNSTGLTSSNDRSNSRSGPTVVDNVLKRQAADRSSSSVITEDVVLLYVEALSSVDREILIGKLMQTCSKGAIDMDVEKDKNIVKTSVITTSNNFFNTSASAVSI